jgi:hypothetical protein
MPSLSAFTDPPNFSIMCLQILNPSPVPVLLIPVVSFSLQKLWKSLPRFSFCIPTPESLIFISKEKK